MVWVLAGFAVTVGLGVIVLAWTSDPGDEGPDRDD
jgi:hypothetical protein